MKSRQQREAKKDGFPRWWSLSRRFIMAGLLVAPAMAGSPAIAAEDNGGFVKPGQELRELRATESGPPASSSDAVRLPEWWSSDSTRLIGLTAATVVMLMILLLVRRRRRLRAGSGGGTRLEMLDRIALSTRQWVCLLRVDEKRVAVGVSGDTMTLLAVMDDTSSGPRRRGGDASGRRGQALEVEVHGREDGHAGRNRSGVDRGVSSLRRDEGTFWFRPGSGPPEAGAPAGAPEDASWENHLAPYRREVNRLRAMLQNWRHSTDHGEQVEKDGGEGAGE